MTVHILSFIAAGQRLSRRLAQDVLCDETTLQYARADGFLPYASVDAFARQAMACSDAIIFIGAAGIAVRAIAPYVRSKATDPAVLVIDNSARFVIPLLSGHIGGANRLAARIAAAIGAQAVITTATDTQGVFAADTWAVEHHCAVRNIDCIKFVSGALLRGETVGLRSDFPIDGALPERVRRDAQAQNGIVISIDADARPDFTHTLFVTPRIVHVGVGCRRNTPPDKLTAWARAVLCELHIAPRAVASVASIDLKQDEAAVHALAAMWDVPTQFYTAQQLEQVSGSFPPSEFVRKTTGTDNVCQRAAARAAKGGACLLEKTARDGMTISVYAEDWRASF